MIILGNIFLNLGLIATQFLSMETSFTKGFLQVTTNMDSMLSFHLVLRIKNRSTMHMFRGIARNADENWLDKYMDR